MDTDWAIARLESWIRDALAARIIETSSTTHRRTTYSFGWTTDAKVVALRAQHDQVRRIVHRLLGLNVLPDLLKAHVNGESVELLAGVVLCQEALGRVRTDAETRAKLGSTAPTMTADNLHPDIWGAASKRWASGNYSDAVQRAATFLNASIQDVTGRHDISDSELMREAFSPSPPTPGKPRLRWPGDNDNLSVRAMRVGILNFSQGLFSAVRNIATHSVEELPRQIAMEQLAALSVLARWVDGCQLVKSA